MTDYNTQIIDEFRAGGGKVAMFGDEPLVILHTIGAKSGLVRQIPLVPLQDGDDLIVFASKAGAPSNPDWYHNLVANPQITVEYGTETLVMQADVVTGDERDRLWANQVERFPQMAEYAESAADRLIPALRLTRT